MHLRLTLSCRYDVFNLYFVQMFNSALLVIILKPNCYSIARQFFTLNVYLDIRRILKILRHAQQNYENLLKEILCFLNYSLYVTTVFMYILRIVRKQSGCQDHPNFYLGYAIIVPLYWHMEHSPVIDTSRILNMYKITRG